MKTLKIKEADMKLAAVLGLTFMVAFPPLVELVACFDLDMEDDSKDSVSNYNAYLISQLLKFSSRGEKHFSFESDIDMTDPKVVEASKRLEGMKGTNVLLTLTSLYQQKTLAEHMSVN